MNAVLVDHLVCPRCGPPNGLVLLAHDVRDRRVHEGEFGCPNCRDRFPVVGGFGDLRPPPRGAGPGEALVSEGRSGGEGKVGERRSEGDKGVAGGDEGVREEGVVGDEGGAVGPGGPGGVGSGVGGGGAPAGDGGGDAGARALRMAAALGVTQGPGMVVVPGSCRDEAAGLARLVRGIEVVVVGWGGRGLAADGVSAFVTGPGLPLRDGVVRGVVAEGGSGVGWWGECLRVLMPGGRIVIAGATDAAREWVRGAGLATLLDESGLLVAALPLPGAAPRMGRWMGAAEKPRP